MVPIRFYNTLTHQVEPFEPLEPGRVYMYNCGPTVYDYAHIGNFKTFLFADVLRRFLELAGHEVHQVMNLTDVGHMTDDQLADGGGEDKMKVAAQRLKDAKKLGKAPVENPDDPYQVAEYYIDAFIADAKALRLKVADEYPQQMPRATQHIEPMQQMVNRLIERGHAYVASDGAVYYSVESFPHYGTLSGNTLEHLRGGAGGRVLSEHQQVKKHPADFLLWKPDASHIMKWPSPWGEGYPGWHIECSAMARALLGRDEIDIHTGGEDNIFPHHECEIAQSRGATGNDRFARLWMHTRHLFVNGQKMSKSKGNFFTYRDIADGKLTGRQVDPAVVRFELIKSHYRSQNDFSTEGLEASGKAVRRLRDYAAQLQAQPADVGADHPTVAAFCDALADDLNIAGAIGIVFEFIAQDVKDEAEAAGVLRAFDSVLAVMKAPEVSPPDAQKDKEIEEQLRLNVEARKQKDYATADAARRRLEDYESFGVEHVKVTAQGTAAETATHIYFYDRELGFSKKPRGLS